MGFKASFIVRVKVTATRWYHERETTRGIPTPFWDSILDKGRYPKDHQPVLRLSPGEGLSRQHRQIASPTQKEGCG